MIIIFAFVWEFFLVSISLLTIFEDFSSKIKALLSCSYSLDKYNSWTCALIDISTRVPPIISSIFIRIFGDMTSSIECEYDFLMSSVDNETICCRRIWLLFRMPSRTCLVTADKLSLYDVAMVKIFCPSQKRDLRGVVDVSFPEAIFKVPHPRTVLLF